MISKRKTGSIIKEIDKHMAKVGKARDDLDTFIDELSSLKEDCSEAWDNLQRARDALSEMV